MIVLATAAVMLTAQVLTPRPTEPSQPPSARADIDDDGGRDRDAEPMSDAELKALSISIDEPLEVQAAPPSPPIAQAPPPLDPHRAADRSVQETFPARPPKKTCPDDGEAGLPVSSSVLAPHLLAPRWEAGAALLGGLVGFGTGHFYAGAPNRGVVMGVTDTLLLGGLAGTIWALNQHVADEDARTGRSLSHGQRDKDGTEKALSGLSWGLGIAAGVSRIFQAFDSYHAAAKTNDELSRVSFVPLAAVAPLKGGGELALFFAW